MNENHTLILIDSGTETRIQTYRQLFYVRDLTLYQAFTVTMPKCQVPSSETASSKLVWRRIPANYVL